MLERRLQNIIIKEVREGKEKCSKALLIPSKAAEENNLTYFSYQT